VFDVAALAGPFVRSLHVGRIASPDQDMRGVCQALTVGWVVAPFAADRGNGRTHVMALRALDLESCMLGRERSRRQGSSRTREVQTDGANGNGGRCRERCDQQPAIA
jgi:hypothetical protein